MTRVLFAILTLFALSVPLTAEAGRKFVWKPLNMRNTSAASVAAQSNWAYGTFGTVTAFADSNVFRVGAATATDRDTSMAYHTSSFLLPPHLETGGGGGTTVVTDSALAQRQPWIALRVQQDTTSFSFSGTSTMDSVFFAAQISYDGINWINVNGTPTVAFETTNGAAGEDGTVPTLIGPYSESNAGQDMATAFLDCVPSLRPINNGYIINRSICLANAYVRFLINMDGRGQYAPMIGQWVED